MNDGGDVEKRLVLLKVSVGVVNTVFRWREAVNWKTKLEFKEKANKDTGF